MRSIVLILLLLLSGIVHSRNNYYEGNRPHDKYGFECKMTISQAYDVLYQKFSNQAIVYKPCYDIKDLPAGTKEYFKVTRSRVPLLSEPSFFGDSMKVMTFAHYDELFPLAGKYSVYKICDPFDPICEDVGEWAETYINGKMVYLKIDEVDRTSAKVFSLVPKPKPPKKGFMDWIWDGIKTIFLFVFMISLPAIFWNGLVNSDSSDSESPKSNYGRYTSSKYRSYEPSHTPQKVRCPDCDGAHPNLLSINYGNGLCNICHGTGEIVTLTDIVENVVTTDFGHTTTCYKCHGTGQCQTCGGTGQVRA